MINVNNNLFAIKFFLYVTISLKKYEEMYVII